VVKLFRFPTFIAAMEPFNFNELPEVVRLLFEKIEHIEELLVNMKHTEDEPHEWLTVDEAAKFLKVSVASLYTRVSRKEIPVSKPGKKLYFNKTDLMDWISAGKIKTIQEIRQEAYAYPGRNRRHTKFI